MKTSATSPITITREITPDNFSRLIDDMADGEKIILEKRNGRVVVSVSGIVGGKREVHQIHQRLYRGLAPLPVKPGWMGTAEIPSDEDTKRRKEHNKSIEKKAKTASSHRDMLCDGFRVSLAFKSLEDGTIHQMTGSDKLWAFQIGEYTVYTRENMLPVKAKRDGEDMIYFSDNTVFKSKPVVVSMSAVPA